MIDPPSGGSEGPGALAGRPRPPSAVSTGVGIAGLVGLAAWMLLARAWGMHGPLAALLTILACGVPMVAWSLLVDKVHRNPSTGIDWDRVPRPIGEAFDLTIVKLAGLWAIWGVIGCLYCIARWYWDGAYLLAMEALAWGAIPMLLLSVPYVLWLDRRLVDPRDGAWHFGQLIIGRSAMVDREILYDFFRAWAVKGFFLAFMISIVPVNWSDTVRPSWQEIGTDSVSLARWLISLMFLVDVSFATVGYVLTMKPLDAHIRSANPYAAGWVAALICYPPFILMDSGGPLDYHPGTAEWTYWLDGQKLALTVVGIILVALTFVYAWATVAFGLRFSNLTHRGILTHGPYAWSKHPAYLSKNLFWWFASMPFLATTQNVNDAVRNSVVLAMVAGVYYWRALTEERHLKSDPVYRDYADWMDRNGPVPRFFNWLRGRPSATPLPAE